MNKSPNYRGTMIDDVCIDLQGRYKVKCAKNTLQRVRDKKKKKMLDVKHWLERSELRRRYLLRGLRGSLVCQVW